MPASDYGDWHYSGCYNLDFNVSDILTSRKRGHFFFVIKFAQLEE